LIIETSPVTKLFTLPTSIYRGFFVAGKLLSSYSSLISSKFLDLIQKCL